MEIRNARSLNILCMLFVFILAGCAHVVSQEWRDAAEQDLSVAGLFSETEAHMGKVVLLGGIIISSSNTPEGTYIEVLEKPLNTYGRPVERDVSRGRFMLFHEGYLDSYIYSEGRKITVAGEVIGQRTGRIDDVEYVYPLILSKELHLLKPSQGMPVFFSFGFWGSF